MGCTYDELGLYGRLRKVSRCGPVSMFRACQAAWRGRGLEAAEVARKVGGWVRDGEGVLVCGCGCGWGWVGVCALDGGGGCCVCVAMTQATRPTETQPPP
jgi:hypothetical protein